MEALARKVLNSAKAMVPGRFEVRPATRQTHPHVAWADYDRVAQTLEGLGFRSLGDVDVVSMPIDASLSRPNVVRMFVSHDGVITGAFYRMALRWTPAGILGRLMGGGRGVVDLMTAFTDGTVIETSTATLADRWQSAPFHRREFQPQMHTGALVARHAQRVGEQVEWNRDARPCHVSTLDEVVAISDAIERKKREFRQSIGWITRDELAKFGADGAKLDNLHALVRRMVAMEAATASALQPHPQQWPGGLPAPAAAASTFVAPPAPASPPPPPETAPASDSPAPAGFTAAPVDDVTVADPSAAEPSSAASVPHDSSPEMPDAPSEPPPLDIAGSPVSVMDAEPARPDARSGIDLPRSRSVDEVTGRALVMNALINLHFRAPVEVVRRWVEANGVAGHLSPRERALLAKPNAEVTPEERTELRGYVEGLWALLWAGGVADDLSPDRTVPGDMAALVPSLKKNEGASMLSGRMRLRPAAELSGMLGRYEERCAAIMSDLSAPDYIARVKQRRKVLAWMLDPSADWDSM